MSDITTRLRRWTHAADAVPASDLMDEAADEIERLRSALLAYTDGVSADAETKPTLTDAEREAVAWCRDNITAMAHPSSAFAHIHAATLRGLLERLK